MYMLCALACFNTVCSMILVWLRWPKYLTNKKLAVVSWCQVLVPAPLELIPLLLLPAGRCQAPHRGADGWVRLRHSRHLAGI